MKGRAAVLEEIGRPPPFAAPRPLRVGEVELEQPGPGELLVRVEAAGVCHSDLSVVDGNRPRPVPIVLGRQHDVVARANVGDARADRLDDARDLVPAKQALAPPALSLVAGARTLAGSYLGSAVPQRDVPAYLSLWRAGRLPVERLLADVVPLEHVNEAMDALAAGEVVPQVVRPGAGAE